MPPKRQRNPGWFKKGKDARRHPLTPEERRRGGINCAQKYTICGGWPLNWLDQCAAKPRSEF